MESLLKQEMDETVKVKGKVRLKQATKTQGGAEV